MPTIDEEIMIKLGIDSKNIAGMNKAQAMIDSWGGKVSKSLNQKLSTSMPEAWQNATNLSSGKIAEAGEKSGASFLGGFQKKLIGRLGLGAILFKALGFAFEAAKDLGWVDKITKTLGLDVLSGAKDEKAAIAAGEEIDRKVAEFEKRRKEIREKEKKDIQEARRELREAWLERQNQQTQLMFAMEKELGLRQQISKIQGESVEKLRLMKEQQIALKDVEERRAAMAKAAKDAEDKRTDLIKQVALMAGFKERSSEVAILGPSAPVALTTAQATRQRLIDERNAISKRLAETLGQPLGQTRNVGPRGKRIDTLSDEVLKGIAEGRIKVRIIPENGK